MKKKARMIAALAVATVAVSGAGWLATRSPVGAGKTVHVLATPT